MICSSATWPGQRAVGTRSMRSMPRPAASAGADLSHAPGVAAPDHHLWQQLRLERLCAISSKPAMARRSSTASRSGKKGRNWGPTPVWDHDAGVIVFPEHVYNGTKAGDGCADAGHATEPAAAGRTAVDLRLRSGATLLRSHAWLATDPRRGVRASAARTVSCSHSTWNPARNCGPRCCLGRTSGSAVRELNVTSTPSARAG